MKRFSFFLAVFSIGLVGFLLMTGQFGALFTGGAGVISDAEPTRPFPDHPMRRSGKNEITIHKPDYERGRTLLTLRGELEGSTEVAIDPTGFKPRRTLINARVEIPIYPAGSLTDQPDDIFELQAERVDYEPGEGPGGEVVRLDGRIHGEGRSGFPVFDTEDVTLRWSEGGDLALLDGDPEKRVQIKYPAVVLRGQNGFRAQIHGSEGLSNIELAPPLIAALTSDSQGSILGFSGEAVLEDRDGVEQKSRVHLYSLGAMRIDTDQSEAVFEGPVYVYQVPAETTLDPPLNLDDLPSHHFRCERLTLELDAVTRRVTRLVADRVEEPVRVFLADRYRVEGDRLIWSEGDREAHLSGEVRIVGEIGEFDAGLARIQPDQGICWLTGGIEARIRGDAISSTTDQKEWDTRLGGRWTLVGERAELHYARGGRRGQRLQSFRAFGAPGEQVTIREDRPNGAVLLGDQMIYEPAEEVIRVTAGEESVGGRPDFREGGNRVRAEQIELAISQPRLSFEGEVEAELLDPPEGMVGEGASWLRPEDPSIEVVTSLRAHRAELLWNEEHRLERIQGWSGPDQPLLLTHQGLETLEFAADEIDWNGLTGEIRAQGDGLQRLLLRDRADLKARELAFSVNRWVATGAGEVELRAMRSAPKREEGPAPPPVQVNGDHLEVILRPPAERRANRKRETVGAVTNGTSFGSSRPEPASAARENRFISGEVVSVRGWSDTSGAMQIEEGSFRAVGDELEWSALEGIVRLHGRERQKVFYRGPVGEDEISAESLEYRSQELRLVLNGETRGRIHQGTVTAEGSERSSTLSWDLAAGALEVLFVEGGEDEIVLQRVLAQDQVVLTQQESQIEFNGDSAHWDAQTERLRIFSPEGKLQTLYRGRGGRRDELLARELLLIRPATRNRDTPSRMEVLCLDVISAKFHLDVEERRDDVETPDVFELRADNLLAEFNAVEGPMTDELASIPIAETRAWGNVDFRGGAYRISSHRAMFRRSNRVLHFEGKGRQKVQVMAHNQVPIDSSREMTIDWLPGQGYRIRSTPARGLWSVRRIEETLQLFEREDRQEEAP